MREEPTTIGLTEKTHDKLHRLRENGFFGELLDGYRFAVAYALASGGDLSEQEGTEVRRTVFNVGTFDPERLIYHAVRALRIDDSGEPIYRTVERLAEWGVIELARQMDQGSLSVLEILNGVNKTESGEVAS